MTQLNFTLEQEFFVGLFSKGREEAFGELMECILNQFIQYESAEKLGAEQYERSGERSDYRNGTRERHITTRVGRITLEVPRHRNEAFHSTILDSYQRNEQALITTMMEMVIQGVATRKVEKITEELCGVKFSKSNVSELCKGLDEAVYAFKNRPLDQEYPFIMADAMYINVREDRKVKSKGLMIAIGINPNGKKEVLGFHICETETKYGWRTFFKSLKDRGLTGVDLVISDDHEGLVSAVKEVFQNSGWQRCQFHFTRNILDQIPRKYQMGLSTELHAMFNAPTVEKAVELRNEIIEEYEDIAPNAMRTLDEGFADAMNIMCLPRKYRKTLRTSNVLERENQELRKRERVIRIFPNEESALRLMGAVLMDHNDDWSTKSRVFSMTEYYDEREKLVPLLRAA
jgi:transposase-like protein